MVKRISAAIVFGASLCFAASAQVLGKIDYLEGSAEITRDGAVVRKVDIGTPVENLDTIKTSADGTVTVSFNKSSGLTGTLQVAPGSTAIIRQDQISGTSSNEVALMAGSVSLKVKRLAGVKSAIQVRTPTSVLGVRGTEFSVSAFNGSSIVACKEGEVACSPDTDYPGTPQRAARVKAASVPGTMVEILESGKVTAADFPAGNFEKNWSDIHKKWKDFNVAQVVSDPVSFLNLYVTNWAQYSSKLDEGASRLRANAVLKAWLKDAANGKTSGSLASWVKERPSVMKDLIDIRGDMMLTVMTWYRLQDLVSSLPASSMGLKLANGQAVKSFVTQFNAASKSVASAIALFTAAEKQYMLRNDGVSPFSEF